MRLSRSERGLAAGRRAGVTSGALVGVTAAALAGVAAVVLAGVTAAALAGVTAAAFVGVTAAVTMLVPAVLFDSSDEDAIGGPSGRSARAGTSLPFGRDVLALFAVLAVPISLTVFLDVELGVLSALAIPGYVVIIALAILSNSAGLEAFVGTTGFYALGIALCYVVALVVAILKRSIERATRA